MSKAEREDLIRLIKQRERVAKTAAEQRSAQMPAEFERQISAAHAFDKNEVWNATVEAARAAAIEANAKIAAECVKLGIPEEFRPSLNWHWAQRGDSAVKERREELRRLAKAEIEAVEKSAKVAIETQSVSAQTEVIAHGLSSEAAVAFLNSLPAVETMMPSLSLDVIAAKLAERARASGGGRPYLVGG
jgi:hypothetical protein